MFRLIGLALVLLCVTACPAAAQRGQQIFDLFMQGVQQDLNRQQQLQFEQQQRLHLKRMHEQFVASWHACHAGDVGACDAALAYPSINLQDRQIVLNKRAAIITAQLEAVQREQRLRLEAAEQRRADQIARQQAEALLHKQQAEQAQKAKREAEAKLLTLRMEQERQNTVLMTIGGLLVLMVLAGIALFVLRSRLKLEWLTSAWARMVSSLRPQASSEARADAPKTAPTAATPPPLPAHNKPRDTPGAIAGLELAYAYIAEVSEADRPGLDDVLERKHLLNTLALASKQLDLAQKLDPDAILEIANDDGSMRFTLNELKSEALLLEGTTHQLYDTHRALSALIAATQLDPSNARAFFVLGLTHAANMHKGAAIAAFEKAVALDPKNITYRKELNRAQNLSGAEVAAYRATRAGERIVDTAATTWNIFAVVWNVLTFPLRVVLFMFRALRLYPFA